MEEFRLFFTLFSVIILMIIVDFLIFLIDFNLL